MKVFLDTNVLVSALATRGLCADLYERLLNEHEVVIGEPVALRMVGNLPIISPRVCWEKSSN